MTLFPSWESLPRKLVAILREIEPKDVVEVTAGLIDAGFRAIEIPLNSPDPFRAIELGVQTAQGILPGECLIGAGTVLTTDDVMRVQACGGNHIVSPNVDAAVIQATVGADMIRLPGVFTPSEALFALASGATGLKFFPASHLGPTGIAAIRAVLPPTASICAVGGVGPDNFQAFMAAGVEGFGLGSSLYKPGALPAQVIQNGVTAVAGYDAALRS
jgi:2-dehydro-3-deoxyphosphogalactonate aldolase